MLTHAARGLPLDLTLTIGGGAEGAVGWPLLLHWMHLFAAIPSAVSAQLLRSMPTQPITLLPNHSSVLASSVCVLLQSLTMEDETALFLRSQVIPALLSIGALSRAFLCGSDVSSPMDLVMVAWSDMAAIRSPLVRRLALTVEWLHEQGAPIGLEHIPIVIEHGYFTLRLKVLRELTREQLLALELAAADQTATSALAAEPFKATVRLGKLVTQRIMQWQQRERQRKSAGGHSGADPASMQQADSSLAWSASPLSHWLAALSSSLPRLLLASLPPNPDQPSQLNAILDAPLIPLSPWHLAEPTPTAFCSSVITLLLKHREKALAERVESTLQEIVREEKQQGGLTLTRRPHRRMILTLSRSSPSSLLRPLAPCSLSSSSRCFCMFIRVHACTPLSRGRC